MKDTLEYKILKHLLDNNNGRFIDISNIESDRDFLKSVIADLKSRKLISTEPYPDIPWTLSNFIGVSPSEEPEKCKVNLSGIEYLESLKPQPIPRYQKIYLPLFILFGLSTMIFAFLNYNSNDRNNILQSEVDSLMVESQNYKDSLDLLKSKIELHKQQSIIDSSQTRN